MNQMKRFVSGLLSITLLFGLTACNSASEESLVENVAAPEDVEEYTLEETTEAGIPAAEDESWRNEELDETEEYDDSDESPFKSVATSPLSTFSSDVDTASYSNMRRFITNKKEPKGIRIEELVNYFDYDYKAPQKGSEDPFAISAEVAECPWNTDHQLAMIGVQGEYLQNTEDVANNIVFLLDVSGSMDRSDKLPLLKESFKMLVDNLGKNDVISIVTYAGNDKVVADSISGSRHKELKKRIDNLNAGGSTAGSKGLETAYELAEKNFIEEGNNRVILATDGDFNVGQSSLEDLKDQIEEAHESGVYISVLGFGMNNLKDNMMEMIADNGNGNYAYIDNLNEAKKVLVDEFDSTMYTIANDLKFQVEFNPAVVSQYRLIGYNNRRMNDEDFNDDTKDAGDIGSGHNVTAFYELVLVGSEEEASVDDLVYTQANPTGSSTDYMTVKVRYQKPGEKESRLVSQVVDEKQFTEKPSSNFNFGSAVVEYGLILVDSEYKADSDLSRVIKRADANRGDDLYGLRKEFVSLVEQYQKLVD